MPAGDYPNIEAALAGPVVDTIKAQWIMLAQPHQATGNYIHMIQDAGAAEYPYNGDHLAASVVNRAPYANIIEEGHQGFHLPSNIRNWTHRNKRGVGYIVIPFRHFTPATRTSSGRAMRNAMPQEIYERARRLGNERLRGLGDLYKQSKSYAYMTGANAALGRPVSAGLQRAHALAMQHEGHPGYTWRASKYEGLQRTLQVTSSGPGGTREYGVYTTFRTLSEDSAGWYIPAQPGLHLAAQTAERIGPLITPLIAQAAMRDAVEVITRVYAGAGFQVDVD